jgi:hypothetical protein
MRVLSDTLAGVDLDDFADLVLLDLSAAFDAVDHKFVTAFAGEFRY